MPVHTFTPSKISTNKSVSDDNLNHTQEFQLNFTPDLAPIDEENTQRTGQEELNPTFRPKGDSFRMGNKTLNADLINIEI